MAEIRGCLAALALIALFGFAGRCLAQPPPPVADLPSGLLYGQPTLVIDPGMHTTAITAAAADRVGRVAVTGGFDKTLRLWDLETGTLLRTIRVPTGPGANGKIYTVAMSPDGALVAAGGQTWGDGQGSVYVFARDTGEMRARIPTSGRFRDPGNDVPNVYGLAFSPDGRFLAAAFGTKGFRIYDRQSGWGESFRDDGFEAPIYALDFASDGRLAVASADRGVRLYGADFRLLATGSGLRGKQPGNLGFGPGGVIAVGYRDQRAVDLLDGATLRPLAPPDIPGLGGPGVARVAWSPDSGALLVGANGRLFTWLFRPSGLPPVYAYDGEATALLGVPGGVLVATAGPSLALRNQGGSVRWRKDAPITGLRRRSVALSVSADGQVVDLTDARSDRLRFDLGTMTLTREPKPDGTTIPPLQSLVTWTTDEAGASRLTVAGQPLTFHASDVPLSTADGPDGKSFVVGTAFWLMGEASTGRELWHDETAAAALAVDVTRDGRLVVAAYDDGTIRWHRMDDGREILALLVLGDDESWVAWTPEGFYASQSGAHDTLQWLVNRGEDAAAEAIPVSRLPQMSRPDALPLVSRTLDSAKAIGLADLASAGRAVRALTGAPEPPGPRLHVLTVGIGDYGPDAAAMHLPHAAADATAVRDALVSNHRNPFGGPGGLYSAVEALPSLTDADATMANVDRAFDLLDASVAAGGRSEDVVVIFLSGHAGMVGTEFYYALYGVQSWNLQQMTRVSLSATHLTERVIELSQKSRVLVLIDACESGGVLGDGSARSQVSAVYLRNQMNRINVDLIASSSPDADSGDDPSSGHGALTTVLLEALTSQADTDHNGEISVSELTDYVDARLPALTGGRQVPSMSTRFYGKLFVAGTLRDASPPPGRRAEGAR